MLSIKKFKLKDLDYKRPLIGFHGSSSVYGKENSLNSFKNAMKYDPEVIEIDIRQSKDGVIYCHHGLFLFRPFLIFFKFSVVKKLFKVFSLEEILRVISQKGFPLIFLDIKEKVRADSLDNICQKFNLEYLLQFYSFDQLRQFKDGFPHQCYLCSYFSFSVFNSFNSMLEKAKKSKADSFCVPFWLYKKENITLAQKNGISIGLSYYIFFVFKMSVKRYKKTISKIGTPIILLNNMKHKENSRSLVKTHLF